MPYCVVMVNLITTVNFILFFPFIPLDMGDSDISEVEPVSKL